MDRNDELVIGCSPKKGSKVISDEAIALHRQRDAGERQTDAAAIDVDNNSKPKSANEVDRARQGNACYSGQTFSFRLIIGLQRAITR